MATLATCFVLTAVAKAQSWPTKPLRAFIPFAAGSATDLVPRAVFEPLALELGQPIVVENRGGAGGTIAGNAVVRAERMATRSSPVAPPLRSPPGSYPICPTTPPRISRAPS